MSNPASTTAASDVALAVNTPVTLVADLVIQAQSPDRVAPGETSVYTLTVHNYGPAPATDIVLTDVLPAGVIPVWTQSARSLCGRQESAVGCDLGDLRGRDTITITLDLSAGGTESLISSTHLAGVIVDLSAPTCAIDHDAAPPHLTCHMARLHRDAAMHVRIGVRVSSELSGSLIHTATVGANESDPDWSNNHAALAMVVDPTATLRVTAVPTTTDLLLRADSPQKVIAGQPFTLTFTITNRGSLDASFVTFQNPLPPATVLDAYAPDSPSCEQRADSFTCHVRNPYHGNPVTFTLVITGHAGEPMSINLDPLMPGWPICTILKERSYLEIVNCALGGLKSGESAQVQLLMIARGVQDRTIINTAIVNASEPELNVLDNTSTSTISVQIESDLAVSSDIFSPTAGWTNLSYTLIVTNMGPSDTTDVVLTDILPEGVTGVTAVASQGRDCQVRQDGASNATVTCELGRLSSGEIATVTVGISVDASWPLGLSETITHSVSVAAKQPDPDLSNNEITQSISR